MTMSVSSESPSPGGRENSINVATWIVRCTRGVGLTSAAKLMAQMGVGVAILTKAKLMGGCHSKFVSGYQVMVTNAPITHQEGVA